MSYVLKFKRRLHNPEHNDSYAHDEQGDKSRAGKDGSAMSCIICDRC